MRNPLRIPEILSLINELWQRNPDLKYCQIIHILTNEISNNGDIFNIEDDKFIEALKNELNSNSK